MPFSFFEVPVYSVGHPLGVVEVTGASPSIVIISMYGSRIKSAFPSTNRFVRSRRYSENGSSPYLLFRDNPKRVLKVPAPVQAGV